MLNRSSKEYAIFGLKILTLTVWCLVSIFFYIQTLLFKEKGKERFYSKFKDVSQWTAVIYFELKVYLVH